MKTHMNEDMLRDLRLIKRFIKGFRSFKIFPVLFLPLKILTEDLNIVDLAGTLTWTPPVNVSDEVITWLDSWLLRRG